MKNSFCVLPWSHVEVEQGGSAKLCCVAAGSITENNRPMTLYHHSFAEIIDSDYMKNIRRSMLEGVLPEVCRICSTHEAASGNSMRLRYLTAWKKSDAFPGGDSFEEIETRTIANGYKRIVPPYYIHLNLGNKCNLKCRMCNPYTSSMLEKDATAVKWNFKHDVADMPRTWDDNALTILPDFVSGIDYRGFNHIFLNTQKLVFFKNSGEINIPRYAYELSRFEGVILVPGTDEVPLRILLDGKKVFASIMKPGLNNLVLEIPPAASSALNLTFIAPPAIIKGAETGICVKNLTLFRSDGQGSHVKSDYYARFSTPGKWFEQTSVLDEILSTAENLRTLGINGGEPMIISQTEYILDRLIDRGCAKKIYVMFNTNGTVFNERMIDKTRHFRNLFLRVSIDGLGAVNEYIRYLSNWDRVEENLLKYKEFPWIMLSVTPTPQAYNAFALPDLLRFCDRNKIDFDLSNVLYYPDYLRITALPRKTREKAGERLREYLEKDCLPHNRKGVSALIGHYLSEEEHPSSMLNFTAFTKEMDISRGQDFRKVFPALYESITDAGVKF